MFGKNEELELSDFATPKSIRTQILAQLIAEQQPKGLGKSSEPTHSCSPSKP